MPRYAKRCLAAAKIQIAAANRDRLKDFLRLAAIRIALYEEQPSRCEYAIAGEQWLVSFHDILPFAGEDSID